MNFFPDIQFGLFNGWLLLACYFTGLIFTSLSFPAEKRKKLFHRPDLGLMGFLRLFRLLGHLAAAAFVVLMVFSPLRTGTAFFYAGLVIYLAGYLVVILSLLDFRRAPTGEAVRIDLYRFSRNPQWVGLVLVYLGAALAAAAWIHLLLLALLAVSYHYKILAEEESCARLYGKSYLEYKEQVSRYLFF